MKDNQVVEWVAAGFFRAQFEGCLEAAGRGRAIIDVGVALIERKQDAMFAGERDEALQIVHIRDRALRVGRAAEVDDRGSGQKLLGEFPEIRQEAVFGRCGQIDRFRAGGKRGCGVALIEGVRHQHGGAFSRFFERGRHQRHVEKRLARAVDGQDLRFGVERMAGAETALQPALHGGAEGGCAHNRRVFAEKGRIGVDFLQHEARKGVLRLAKREDEWRLSRLDALDQRIEARKGALGQSVEA